MGQNGSPEPPDLDAAAESRQLSPFTGTTDLIQSNRPEDLAEEKNTLATLESQPDGDLFIIYDIMYQ